MLNKMPLLRATLIWIAITAVALGLSMPAHAASWGLMERRIFFSSVPTTVASLTAGTPRLWVWLLVLQDYSVNRRVRLLPHAHRDGPRLQTGAIRE